MVILPPRPKETPGNQFWPQQTYLKDRSAYSNLIRQDTSFYTFIKLPYVAHRYPEVVKKEQEILTAWVQCQDKKYGK